jgi:phosphate acyltransferase
MAIRVAVDAMGGDRAPSVVIEGAIRATEAAPDTCEILLFGPEDRLRAELKSDWDISRYPIQIVNAPEVIGMGESPAAAVKGKPKSSIHLGLAAHKQGQADVFVSAGNTGAVMAASLFILGRLANVARPSVIGYYPTTKSYCIVIDVGTNVDCKPEHLVQFAQMGSIYARTVMQRENPVVALMNIGEEPGKGNEQVKEAYDLLRSTPGLNFRGNIEGRDVLDHAADVIVSDGFVGNIMLKLGESIATGFIHMIDQEMSKQQLSPEQRQVVMQVLRGVLRQFDYQEYGGAPLLGVNGNVIIGHGGSSARAIERLILKGVEVARQDLPHAINSALSAPAA